MKLRLLDKTLVIFCIAILILFNFYAVNFSTSSDTVRASGKQPYNSFKQFNWGGIGEQTNDKYGWNLTYIENFNGDEYPDLVIGAPMYDQNPQTNDGAVFIFYGSMDNSFNNIKLIKSFF